MNSPAIHSNQLQMRTDTQRVGTNALGQCVSALTCRWQGRQHSRAVGSRVVYSDRLSAFLMLTLPETGGGRHKLPSFFQVSQPRCLESSPPGGAGRGLSALPQALPTFEFCVRQPRRQAIADLTPSTHQVPPCYATNVAREAINDVEEVCK